VGSRSFAQRALQVFGQQSAPDRARATGREFVAGFRAWLELGYQVRKGETAIWILAPLKIKERDRLSGEETGDTRILFHAVPVFDRAQVTAGEHAAPLEPRFA
jgi:hypothetical protein